MDYIYVGGNASVFKLPFTENGNTTVYNGPSKIINNDTEERDIDKNDIDEMKAIFNPRNLDIKSIGNKYLHTLKLMKKPKLIKKGGRKRKHIRHKKTNKRKHKNCKNKTKRTGRR